MPAARHSRVFTVAAFLVLSAAQWANSEPLLLNASFESGSFEGWTVSIPAATPNAFGVGMDGQLIPGVSFFGPAYVTVRTGNFAAYMDGAAFYNQGLLLSQTLMLEPGRYSLGFFLGSDTPGVAGFGANAQILVNNTPLPVIGVPTCVAGACNSAGMIPADASFGRFTGSFFTEGGGPFTLAFLVSGSGTGAAGISMDDAFLNHTPVPEPASVLLLAAGLAGVAARHRSCARRTRV
jgi:hypothetical protein